MWPLETIVGCIKIEIERVRLNSSFFAWKRNFYSPNHGNKYRLEWEQFEKIGINDKTRCKISSSLTGKIVFKTNLWWLYRVVDEEIEKPVLRNLKNFPVEWKTIIQIGNQKEERQEIHQKDKVK